MKTRTHFRLIQMHKALLTGVAALFLATGTAHATGSTLPNTDPLIGNWCNTKVPGEYKRGMCSESFTTDNLTIRQDSYSEDQRSHCTYLKVKPIRNGYETFSDCKSAVLHQWQKATIRIINKKLHFTGTIPYRIQEGHDVGSRRFCVAVQPSSDGYLNLRAGPGMQFEAKFKLVPRDTLKAVAISDEEWNDIVSPEWTYISSVIRMENGDRKIDGWVYSKYVKKCAALLIATSAAHATTLPDTIVGKKWCLDEDTFPDPLTYHQVKSWEDCHDAILVIQPTGDEYIWDKCIYDKIEQIASDVYHVHARCEAQAEGGSGGIGIFWCQNLEYKIVDGHLIVTQLPEL